MEYLCYLCLVFAMLSRLFIAAFVERADLLALVVMFIVIVSLSYLVSWDSGGT